MVGASIAITIRVSVDVLVNFGGNSVQLSPASAKGSARWSAKPSMGTVDEPVVATTVGIAV